MHHLRPFIAWIFSFGAAMCASAQCSGPLAIVSVSNHLQISWQGPASLQTASTLRGPWQNLTTNNSGPYSLSATGAAAFFRLAITPQDVNHEGLLFYNPNTGSAAIGEILTNQFITRKSFSGTFALGWTHITQVPGPGGIVFFYNSVSGVGSYSYMSADNFATFETINGFFPWTHVEGIVQDGSSVLFFYNATNGAYVSGNSSDLLATNWTHILRARHSNLTLFYRASNGSGMLNFAPPVTNFSAGYFPTGATHVATMPRPAGGDYVLFYTRTNGAGVFGVLNATGFQPTITYGPGSFGNWSHVIGLDDQNFFFYSAGNGAAAIGAMLNDTNFVTTRTYPAGSFSAGWSSIIRADLATMLQGFCWPESASPGEAIDFFTSTGAGAYSAAYVRLLNQATQLVNFATVTQNGELVEQVVCGPFTLPGALQNTAHNPSQGCADWNRSFTLTVPADWPSGIYAVKLIDSAGSTTYVPFVVKAPATNHGDFLLVANTTTWNAYNPWGGYSRYGVPGGGAWLFSYLRPNPLNLNPTSLGYDYQYNSKHLTRGELWVQNWLRDAGYRVDVASDLDLHNGITGLNAYKGLILSTHPEYFSTNMFNAITNYLAHGGHLIYLGANGLYDAVDVNTNLRTLTVYGTSGVGRTHLFRLLSPPQPESSVLGIAYPWSLACGDGANLGGSRVAYEVLNSSHPFFAGTGLTNGAQFGAMGWSVNEGGSTLADGGASGWEIDVIDTNSPPGVQLLARGTNPYTLNCDPYVNVPMAANMVYYTHPGGGFVFSVGSMTFGGSLVVDDRIQRILRNALDECLP
jgi:hypothetical protein